MADHFFRARDPAYLGGGILSIGALVGSVTVLNLFLMPALTPRWAEESGLEKSPSHSFPTCTAAPMLAMPGPKYSLPRGRIIGSSKGR